MDKWYKRSIFLLLFIMSALLVLLYVNQRSSVRELTALTQKIKNQSELTQNLKEQVDEVEKNNKQLGFTLLKITPTIRGDIYGPTRQRVIRDQARQVPKGGIVIIGDSNTDIFWIPEICGLSVLNSGVCASGVDWHLQNLSETLAWSKPKIVVIVLGVNDAHTPAGKSIADYKKEWTFLYERLVDGIDRTGTHVVLSTILPVEKDKGLGAKFFNCDLIKDFNREIIRIGLERKLKVIDSYKYFATSEGYMSPDGTVDGVHLTPKSYEKFRSLLTNSLSDIISEINGQDCS